MIQLASAGVPQAVIAEDIGVHVSTLSKWLKWGDDDWEPKDGQECPEDRQPYREFRERYRQAQAKPVITCEAIWMNAVKGTPAIPADPKKGTPYVPAVPPDPKAAERWLKLHRPDLYREHTDISVDFGDRQGAMDAWKQSILNMGTKPPDDPGDDE